MRLRSLSLGLLLFGAQTQMHALAQETVFTNRVTELRAAADSDAKVLQTLPEKAPVQVLERKGPWSRVQIDKGTAKETGWVRMMHLRGGVVVGEAPQQTAGGSLAAGFNRLLGGSSTTAPKAQSATLGVRGLSAEEIGNAAPNDQALAKVKSLAASKPDAEKFAAAAPLAKVDVADASDAKGGRK